MSHHKHSKKNDIAFGIDIGGSGIKGAPVDLNKGEFAADRLRIPTPQPATTSIYDMALPIATNVDHGDDDDDDDSAAAEDDDEDEQQEQPPAKRQRLESAGS